MKALAACQKFKAGEDFMALPWANNLQLKCSSMTKITVG